MTAVVWKLIMGYIFQWNKEQRVTFTCILKKGEVSSYESKKKCYAYLRVEVVFDVLKVFYLNLQYFTDSKTETSYTTAK